MTDTIKHHLNDAVLMAYSAGTLPEAFNLIVASHLSLCDDCRARAGSFDALGGEILDQQAEASVAADSFEATMALIESGAPDTIKVSSPENAVLPGPLLTRRGARGASSRSDR